MEQLTKFDKAILVSLLKENIKGAFIIEKNIQKILNTKITEEQQLLLEEISMIANDQRSRCDKMVRKLNK